MSLHEKVMELQGNIRVFTRCRPTIYTVDNIEGDLDAGGNGVDGNQVNNQGSLSLDSSSNSKEKDLNNKIVSIQSSDPNILKSLGWGEEVIVKDVRGYDTKTKLKFEYDACFPPSATQEQVFSQVKPLVTSFLDGYNVCIFAYGQTGSGKVSASLCLCIYCSYITVVPLSSYSSFFLLLSSSYSSFTFFFFMFSFVLFCSPLYFLFFIHLLL